MAAVDYKQKYIDLRAKFAKTCDKYYRAGYEEGMKEGQMQAQQEQMMQQQQQEMIAQGIDPETGQPIQGGAVDENGMPIEDQGAMEAAQEGMAPEGMDEAQGSELDQHINELEGLVSKGEKPKVTDLRKAVKALASLRKSQKAKLKSNHKEVTVSKQKDLVNNMLKKWESEANKSVTDNLEEIIASEGIKIDQ